MSKLNKFALKTLAAAVCAASIGAAHADPFYINVGPAGGNGLATALGDNTTDALTSYQIYAQTLTTQFNTVAGGVAGDVGAGDRFVDSGNATFTAPLPPLSYGAGIGFGGPLGAEITVSWTNLQGKIDGVNSTSPGTVTFDASYQAGAVLQFRYQAPGNANFGGDPAVGTNASPLDDTGITDGTLVLELMIKGGEGLTQFTNLGEYITGSFALRGEVITALPGMWFFAGADGLVGTADDEDFADLIGSLIEINADINADTDNVTQTPCLLASGDTACAADPGGFGDQLFSVISDHDGSIFKFRKVPEPGSIALLGLGLVGLAGAMRRRQRG